MVRYEGSWVWGLGEMLLVSGMQTLNTSKEHKHHGHPYLPLPA